jgi:hypothetical protein
MQHSCLENPVSFLRVFPLRTHFVPYQALIPFLLASPDTRPLLIVTIATVEETESYFPPFLQHNDAHW